MKVKYYDTKLKQSEKSLNFPEKKVSEDALLQKLRVIFTNSRAANAKVKNRANVRGGGKKPWRQKGTGRARHGSIRSPLWVGGGVAHGPIGRTWGLTFNKKVSKNLYNMVLQEKAKKGDLAIVEFSLKNPSTKEAKKAIDKVFNDYSGNLLVLTTNEKTLKKSLANIPGVLSQDFLSSNVFDILRASKIILTSESINNFEKRVNEKSSN